MIMLQHRPHRFTTSEADSCRDTFTRPRKQNKNLTDQISKQKQKALRRLQKLDRSSRNKSSLLQQTLMLASGLTESRWNWTKHPDAQIYRSHGLITSCYSPPVKDSDSWCGSSGSNRNSGGAAGVCHSAGFCVCLPNTTSFCFFFTSGSTFVMLHHSLCDL